MLSGKLPRRRPAWMLRVRVLYSYEWLLIITAINYKPYCISGRLRYSHNNTERSLTRCLILHRKHLQPRNYRTVALLLYSYCRCPD